MSEGSRSPGSNSETWTARLAWEHTHREMLPALLFLRHLQDCGIRWSLEHVEDIGPGVSDQEILFIPFYYDDRDLEKYLFRGDFRGKWLVNLAYEQMHFACGRSYLLPDGRFAREQMVHCAWGDRFRDLLVGHGIPPQRIRMTGHPRFDIYSRPELLYTREELASMYGLDASRMWILIPHNFNFAFVSKHLIKQLAARRYHVSDEFVEGVRLARDAFGKLVLELSDAFPEAEIILRVHPAGYEDEGHYGREVKDRRLHVIAHYDIANWIMQAALTIVWNSTSAMEAMVAGRPVVSYEPFPFAERFDYDVNRIVPTFSRTEDLFEVVRALPNPELTYDWALFEQWYKYRDGKNFERLADVVKEAMEGPGSFASRKKGVGFAGGLKRLRQPWKITHAPPQEQIVEAVRSLSAKPLNQFLR